MGEGVRVEREGGESAVQTEGAKKTKTGEAEQSGDLAGRLAVVELFGEQLDPLQHGGLEEEAQRRVSFSAQEAAPNVTHRVAASHLLLGVDERLQDKRRAELENRNSDKCVY